MFALRFLNQSGFPFLFCFLRAQGRPRSGEVDCSSRMDHGPLPTGRERCLRLLSSSVTVLRGVSRVGQFGEMRMDGWGQRVLIRSVTSFTVGKRRYINPLSCLEYLLSSFNRVSIILQSQRHSRIITGFPHIALSYALSVTDKSPSSFPALCSRKLSPLNPLSTSYH